MMAARGRGFGEGPTQVAGGKFHEGETKPFAPEDFRFTTAAGHLYAIELGWPEAGQVVIHSVTPDVKVGAMRLLGVAKLLAFTQDAAGLHLRLPAARPGAYAWVYRIDRR